MNKSQSWLRAVVLEKDELFRNELINMLRKHNFSVIDVDDCEAAFRHIATLKPELFIYGQDTKNFTCLDVAYFVRRIIKAQHCKIIHCYDDEHASKRKLSETNYIDCFVQKHNKFEIMNTIEKCGLDILCEV